MSMFISKNFFQNEFEVDKVREFGLSQFMDKNLINDSKPNYPGVRSDLLCEIHPELNEYILKKISYPIINLSEAFNIKIKEKFSFKVNYHLTTSIHECGLIHRDNCTFAGVIYLTPNAPPNSGTKIYSPKEKFLELVKQYKHKNFAEASTTTNLKIISEFCKEKKEYNQKCFDIEYNVVNEYNSIVVYPANYWHGPGDYFGETLENARLSLVIFFDYVD